MNDTQKMSRLEFTWLVTKVGFFRVPWVPLMMASYAVGWVCGSVCLVLASARGYFSDGWEAGRGDESDF